MKFLPKPIYQAALSQLSYNNIIETYIHSTKLILNTHLPEITLPQKRTENS